MRVRLKFTEGALAGETREFEVQPGSNAMIGRRDDCTVVLGEQDRTASGRHAKLWVDGDRLYVTDLGSQSVTVEVIRHGTESDDVVGQFLGSLGNSSEQHAFEVFPQLIIQSPHHATVQHSDNATGQQQEVPRMRISMIEAVAEQHLEVHPSTSLGELTQVFPRFP